MLRVTKLLDNLRSNWGDMLCTLELHGGPGELCGCSSVLIEVYFSKDVLGSPVTMGSGRSGIHGSNKICHQRVFQKQGAKHLRCLGKSTH
jgi:hypothetical protein